MPKWRNFAKSGHTAAAASALYRLLPKKTKKEIAQHAMIAIAAIRYISKLEHESTYLPRCSQAWKLTLQRYTFYALCQ